MIAVLFILLVISVIIIINLLIRKNGHNSIKRGPQFCYDCIHCCPDKQNGLKAAKCGYGYEQNREFLVSGDKEQAISTMGYCSVRRLYDEGICKYFQRKEETK